MAKFKSSLFGVATFLAFLSTTAILPSQLLAKEVKILVSGPWAYADDPFNSGHIVLIVVTNGHVVHLVGDEDIFTVWNTSGHFEAASTGSYSIDFPTKCTGTATSNIKTYPLPVTSEYLRSRIDKRSSGKRVAISVPKPCSYEQIGQPSEVMLNRIGQNEIPSTFSVITLLHYTVEDAVNTAQVTGKGDRGETLKQSPKFKQGGATRQDIAIVAADPSDTPEPTCDQPSADMFDQSLVFWGQPPVLRLFPGVGPNGEQTTYDFVHCPTSAGQTKTSNPGDSRGKHVPAPFTPDATTRLIVPSHTDCHSPQMSVTVQ